MDRQAAPRRSLPPCHVQHVTRSRLLSLLTLLLTLRGLISLFRIIQRGWWLLFDFKPLGLWQEAVMMAVVEGCVLVSCLISISMAIAVLRLRMRQSSGGGRMLYRLQRFCSVIYTLAALLLLLLTGGFIFLAVHYRWPVLLLGWGSVIGTALFIICWVSRMFHKNAARCLADVNRSIRTGYFQRGGGVSCFLQTQGWLLAMFQLIPMAMVIL